MIKIRYRGPNELSPGVHAAAERHGRSTVVYLLSGLTAAERSAALRRLRISARRGYGPRLPPAQLALALLADRVRTTLGQTGAVFRSHPAGSTVPVMVVSAGAIAFLALSAVSIRVLHHPRGPARPPLSATVPILPGAAGSGGPVTRDPAAGRLADPAQADPDRRPATSSRSSGSPSSPVAAPNSGSTSSPSNGSGSGADSGPGGGTTLTGGIDPSPVPGTAADTASAASPSSAAATPSSAATTPAPTPSAGKSGLCVNVGPLGVCL
jgi:hypothetical protein